MTLFNAFRPAVALSDVLDKERKAILDSDFEALAKLMTYKEALLPRVVQANLPAHVLAPLKLQSEANNRLLAAAANGIKSAKSRLTALRRPAASFTTYGPAGAPTSIGQKPKTITRKA